MSARTGKPRLGFVGVGWIGQHRMRAVLDSGTAEVVAFADPSADLRTAALALAPRAQSCTTLDELLALELDGVAIATPSALHAEHARACLQRGLAVFCQKPLARTLAETRSVVETARTHNRLLEVDFSYRNTAALRAIKGVLESGDLGPIYSARFVFHNAYGPDKPWYYDRASSGGGCVMDLGVHLVDSALWLLEGARVERVDSALYAQGERLTASSTQVEDYAVARLDLQGGAVVELACSWKLPAGVDAVIEAELYGPYGGLRFRNVNGSFYDFVAERMHGTSSTRLAEPPDEWGGRTIVKWTEQLAQSADYAVAADRFLSVAEVIDQIYAQRATTRMPRARQNAASDPGSPG
ncbi:MAG: oxidoreductase protein [Myxococcaceae bacterium]|nr:oxidoreductase protein [Myxococcaceae bacterium]